MEVIDLLHHNNVVNQPESNFTRQLSSYQAEVLFSCVNASKGKLFGGFVRSVLDESNKFKDIDIWFRTEDDRNDFIKMLSEHQTFTYPFPLWQIASDTTVYGFDKTVGQWLTSSEAKDNAILDLVVSSIYPVNDFTINCLSFDGVNYSSEVNYFDSDEIKVQIINKFGYFLPEFQNKLDLFKNGDKALQNHLANSRFMKFTNVYGYTLNPLSMV